MTHELTFLSDFADFRVGSNQPDRGNAKIIMSDFSTNLAELRDLVRRFVDERDWRQFHSPKNLSMALAIEAAELMEHFQWISVTESRAMDEKRRDAVRDELADVLCYVIAIANELDIDLTEAVREKMKKNAVKYPAEEYRGRYGPEDAGQRRPEET